MQWPDLVNAGLEAGASLFMLLNVRRLLRDKVVRGTDWRVMAFFTMWGGWNLFYYPVLGQWFSFYAGVSIAVANAVYLYLMLYYILQERKSDD